MSTSRLVIQSEADIVTARRVVREAAASLGFGLTDVTRIVTAASELARNIVTYAGSGTLTCRAVRHGERYGIELVFDDEGPGIADLACAMRIGFTTSGGLGLGLPGTRRLMDEMEIETGDGKTGTCITLRKWLRR